MKQANGIGMLCVALVAMVAFIAAVEIVLLWPSFDIWDAKRLGPAEVISLISGAVTAAGLSALYLQFREYGRQRTSERREHALHIDQFYSEFVSEAMQVWRRDGWTYLEFLANDKEAFAAFAQWWIGVDVPAPKLPGRTRKEPTDHIWALTVMIAFFYRLEQHFAAHFETSARDQAVIDATNVFFWKSWSPGLTRFADECQTAFVDVEPSTRLRGLSTKEPPYFRKAFASLNERLGVVAAAPPYPSDR